MLKKTKKHVIINTENVDNISVPSAPEQVVLIFYDSEEISHHLSGRKDKEGGGESKVQKKTLTSTVMECFRESKSKTMQSKSENQILPSYASHASCLLRTKTMSASAPVVKTLKRALVE